MKSILLLEAQPDLSRVLNEILTHFGFHVTEARSVEEGLNRLSSATYSAVIMDCDEYSARAADFVARVDVPVVLLTDSPDPMQLAMTLVVEYFIMKPFTLDELLTTIQSAAI